MYPGIVDYLTAKILKEPEYPEAPLHPDVKAARTAVIEAADAFYTGPDSGLAEFAKLLAAFARFSELALQHNPHVSIGNDETGLVVRFRDGTAAVLTRSSNISMSSPSFAVTGLMHGHNPLPNTPSFDVTGARPRILG
jgi:hypothetical protein